MQQSKGDPIEEERRLTSVDGQRLTRRILRPDLPKNFFSIATGSNVTAFLASPSRRTASPIIFLVVVRASAIHAFGIDFRPWLRLPALAPSSSARGSMRASRRHATKYRSGLPRRSIYYLGPSPGLRARPRTIIPERGVRGYPPHPTHGTISRGNAFLLWFARGN